MAREPRGRMPELPMLRREVIVIDYDSGRVLASQKPDERMEPASITKVMTSYVTAAEVKNGKIKSDDLVTISERAWREGGAGMLGNAGSSNVQGEEQKTLDVISNAIFLRECADAIMKRIQQMSGQEYVDDYAPKKAALDPNDD